MAPTFLGDGPGAYKGELDHPDGARGRNRAPRGRGSVQSRTTPAATASRRARHSVQRETRIRAARAAGRTSPRERHGPSASWATTNQLRTFAARRALSPDSARAASTAPPTAAKRSFARISTSGRRRGRSRAFVVGGANRTAGGRPGLKHAVAQFARPLEATRGWHPGSRRSWTGSSPRLARISGPRRRRAVGAEPGVAATRIVALSRPAPHRLAAIALNRYFRG